MADGAPPSAASAAILQLCKLLSDTRRSLAADLEESRLQLTAVQVARPLCDVLQASPDAGRGHRRDTGGAQWHRQVTCRSQGYRQVTCRSQEEHRQVTRTPTSDRSQPLTGHRSPAGHRITGRSQGHRRPIGHIH